MIIQLTTNQVVGGTVSLALLLSLVQWLLANWIKTRLEKSIQHEYDKKLEDYRFSQLQRKKAEVIAQIFAKWIKYRGEEEKLLNKKELINYYEELNKMSLELALWIQDKEILNDVMSRFHGDQSAKDIRSLTGQIRKLILDNKNDAFDPQNIILWPEEEISKKLFCPDQGGSVEDDKKA